MTGHVTVRPGLPEDLPAALRLAPRLAEGAAPWRPRDGFLASAHRWIEDSWSSLDAEDRAVWVAETAGVVVGIATAGDVEHFTGQRDCYLGELAVDTSVEGTGVGRSLVDHVEAWARARGLAAIRLDTGAANAAARAFYAKFGFLEEQVQLTKPLTGP